MVLGAPYVGEVPACSMEFLFFVFSGQTVIRPGVPLRVRPFTVQWPQPGGKSLAAKTRLPDCGQRTPVDPI